MPYTFYHLLYTLVPILILRVVVMWIENVDCAVGVYESVYLCICAYGVYVRASKLSSLFIACWDESSYFCTPYHVTI